MLGRITLCIVLLSYTAASDTKLTEITICLNERTECFQTNFTERIQCINRHRTKRQTTCNTNTPCTGNSCNTNTPCTGNGCDQPCNGIGCDAIAPEPFLKPQKIIDTCLESCLFSCTGSNCSERCETSCQTPLTSTSNSAITVENMSQYAPVPIQPAPNVTTIIRLTNIINNTNIVNAPTTLNNTNINNINLGTNVTSKSINSEVENEKCCYVVRPRVCQNTLDSENKTLTRCINRQHRTCGKICTSKTLHAQVRQPCNGPPSTCAPSVAYIPQPTPRCVYQPQWPYVRCGIFENRNCKGCYDHYGYGFENYHGNLAPSCVGCYDDGYNLESLYRQGPYYRPGYYHTPPVYLGGDSQLVVEKCGLGGCFGNELIDPVFGVPSYSPYSTSVSQFANYYQNPSINYIPALPYYAPVVRPIQAQNNTLNFETVEQWYEYLDNTTNNTPYPYPPINYNSPQYVQGYGPIPFTYPIQNLPYLRLPVNETIQ